jgi:hypothetical protein
MVKDFAQKLVESAKTKSALVSLLHELDLPYCPMRFSEFELACFVNGISKGEAITLSDIMEKQRLFPLGIKS